MDEQWKKLTQYQMATRQMSIFDGTQDFRIGQHTGG